MGCNCGKFTSTVRSYEVRYSDGRPSRVFLTEAEARVAAESTGGQLFIL